MSSLSGPRIFVFIRCFIAAIALGAMPLEAASSPSSRALNTLADRYFEANLRLFPLEATAIADHRYNDRFTDFISDRERAKQKTLYESTLRTLRGIDRARLTPEDAVTYDALEWELRTRLAGHEFIDRQNLEVIDHLMPVNQFWGPFQMFVRIGSGSGFHPFKTPKDYDDFLGRMKGFRKWSDAAIVNMRRGMATGIVLPRVLVERVLQQLEAQIVDDVTKSGFYAPVNSMPATFDERTRRRITATYTKAIREEVIPTYRRLRDFMKETYLPAARTTDGLGHLPGGSDRYAFLTRLYTTTSMTPDEIHELGLREVTRIRGEMDKVRTELNFEGDLKALFDRMRTDPKLYPFRTDEEILAAYRAIESRLSTSVPRYFSLLPKAAFEVHAMEKSRAASGSEQYSAPSPDGTRPGIFYVPITDPKRYNVIRMESLFLHEAIPGHHFQFSIAQEQPALPKFRRYGWHNAYGEGWALYTESLGKELGLYTDPYQYFGALTQEMHRAIRLVVDTGMHAKGWTRQQAITYSLENEGLAEDSIRQEIERYLAIPAQALSYKVGQLKISELRRKAEVTLGTRFDLRAFHDEILRDGSLPLEVLERKINAWIARNAATTTP